jgi:hypothetical protein
VLGLDVNPRQLHVAADHVERGVASSFSSVKTSPPARLDLLAPVCQDTYPVAEADGSRTRLPARRRHNGFEDSTVISACATFCAGYFLGEHLAQRHYGLAHLKEDN